VIETFPSGTASRIGPSGIRRQGLRVVGSGSSSFTPASLGASLLAWYKADAGTSSTVDGTALSAWNDQSGNGKNFAQATGANQPLYKAAIQNGLPVVRFDGSNDFMDAATVSASQPDTIWLVAKSAIGGGSGHNALDGISSRQAVYQDAAAGAFIAYFAGVTVPSAVAWGTTAFHYISALFNGASSVLRSDGVQISTGNPSSGALTGLRVGGADGSGTNQWNGDIGEIVIASGDQTAQFSNMETYLKNRWGL
jgi:hypothetical protein